MKLKPIFTFVLEIIFNLFKINKHVVVFYSFNGQYNDNPRFISESLHKYDKEIQIVWLLNKQSWDVAPSYVKKIKVGTIKSLFYSSIAAVFVDNYTGKHTFRFKKNVPAFFKLLKRKKQLNISTWHGTPFKKIHNDISGIKMTDKTCFTTCDYFCSGNKFLSKIIYNSLPNKIKILEIGSPRNDVLLRAKNESKKLTYKEQCGYPKEKKVLLYAPTFRENKDGCELKELTPDNVRRLLDACSKKFGGEWVISLRIHPGIFGNKAYSNLSFSECEEFVDGNIEQEMAFHLIACDALLTDYSGSMFDACYLNIPCFLYANDFDNYSHYERGLYFALDELPFGFANSWDELIACILSFEEEKFVIKKNRFLNLIGNQETGNSCDKICEIILRYLKTI